MCGEVHKHIHDGKVVLNAVHGVATSCYQLPDALKFTLFLSRPLLRKIKWITLNTNMATKNIVKQTLQ